MIEVKKEHLLLAVTFSVIIASASYAYTSLRSYSSSSECIVGSMSNVSSDKAASFIRQACFDMFGGEIKVPSKKLSIDKVNLLDGKAYLGDIYPYTFNITAYNGNEDTTISGIYVNINYINKSGNNTVKRYYKKVEIAPLSISKAHIDVEKPEGDYTWEISGADGYLTAK
ncbi:TPA: hypothetical protein I8455_000967 [Aeromonas hydrophila]|uniref:hypothetical protein n=1 Tax=Aeromonas dhakensis TaxID=196024 RepID=UPI001A31DC09|nr:hypothetical protein [Aeromonas dhakensis]HAT2246291.1 hypothetical protein [Aeromonas hydrophila]HAT2381701.1 hypothetical protein [Aeromonas hydrophila]HAT2414688.1 hypothetical protein [Aeromonas hydrophila]HAT2525169.1 hypothetical protein [Aeromonas hydrophila]HAT2545196.1 hypothetical protein [Aeromonas hydrophila]